jgi:hypothetical protein
MLATLTLLLSSAAPSLALDWRGLPECPPRASFLQEVRRLRGEVGEASAGEADVTVQVTVDRSGLSWRARVETRSLGGQGLRVLEADTCAQAVDAAAVVVALALADPLAAPDPSLPDGGVELVEVAGPQVTPAVPWTFALGLTGGVRAGLLPVVAPGASVAAVLSHQRLRLELTLTTPFLVNVTQGVVQAEVAAWLGGRLSGCFEFAFGRLALGPCLLVHAAWLGGRGTGGLETRTSGNGGFLAASGGLFARFRLVSELWLRLDGSGGAALVRPRFVASQSDTVSVVATPQPWLIDGNLGVEYRFQ